MTLLSSHFSENAYVKVIDINKNQIVHLISMRNTGDTFLWKKMISTQ